MYKLTQAVEKLNFPQASSSEDWAKAKVERANSLPGSLGGYDCKRCLNRGYTLRLDGDGAEWSTPCSCLKIRAAIRAAERSGLDAVISRLTFKAFLTPEPWQQKLKAAAQAFVKGGSGSWFYVGGNPGSGKTHICTAMCGALLKAGHEVRYFVWPSDMRRLKAMVNEPEYDKTFGSYADAQVLYIDDLFKSRTGNDLTASDINRTFELINRRDQQPGKLTIISSEHSISSVIGIDEAIGSRIWANANNNVFDLGSDRRRNWRLYGKSGERQ